MLSRYFNFYIFISLLFVSVWLLAKEPGKDHPLISRFPGSQMKYYEEKKFDQFPVLHCGSSKLLHNIQKCQIT